MQSIEQSSLEASPESPAEPPRSSQRPSPILANPAGLRAPAEASWGQSGPAEGSPSGSAAGTPPTGLSTYINELKSLHPDPIRVYEQVALRAERLGKGKLRTLDFARFMGEILGDCDDADRERLNWRRTKLERCASFLGFQVWEQLGQQRLGVGYFCQQPLGCIPCAIRRGAKHLTRYAPKFAQVLAAHPGTVPQLVTVTVKNGPDLVERVEHLQRSIDQLMQRVRNKRTIGRGQTSLPGLIGATVSIECKLGSGSGLWHPHGHMAAIAEDLFDQDKLSAEWLELTGDSYIVDVRPMHSWHDGQLNPDELLGDLLEVFKYQVKVGELEHPHRLEAWNVLGARRLLRSFGKLYGVKVPEGCLDEALDLDEAACVWRFFSFFGNRYVQQG